MLNCGLTRLCLVSPRDGWPSPEASAAASGADIVIENVRICRSTREAVQDLHRVYATTARPRGMTNRIVTPRRAAEELQAQRAAGLRSGVLFGPERAGLTNDDIALADTIIEVPLNPAFRSLNLAQAVLIVAYEWLMTEGDRPPERLETNQTEAASKGELENFFGRLEAALDEGGFFKAPEMRPIILRNIRNLFQRADLTEQEVRTLHGVLEAIRRAGRVRPRERT